MIPVDITRLHVEVRNDRRDSYSTIASAHPPVYVGDEVGDELGPDAGRFVMEFKAALTLAACDTYYAKETV